MSERSTAKLTSRPDLSQRGFRYPWVIAKKAGVVLDIWKCVGSRRVIVIANVDGPDTLDQILLDLPIMKLNGQHVQVEVTPLRRFEDFAADVKKRLE